MEWWVWFLVGFALLGAEIILPSGFFLLFFGLGALIMGAVLSAGVVLVPAAQWMSFSALSLLLVAVARKKMLGVLQTDSTNPNMRIEGEVVTVSHDLPAQASGKGELGGALWTVKNVGTGTIPAGTQVRVLRRDGLTLEISI